MKIGILGGTFNPPHLGHLAIAKVALKKFNLDKVIFMVSTLSPLKKPRISVEKRMKMVKIMVQSFPKFAVSYFPIKKASKSHKKSYTIDTFYIIKRKHPKDKIYWLIGEDSWQEILQGKWKQSKKLIQIVNFIVFERPGFSKYVYDKKRYGGIKFVKMEYPISSTEIRRKIRKGQSVKKYLTKNVLDYIIKSKLYKNDKRLSRN